MSEMRADIRAVALPHVPLLRALWQLMLLCGRGPGGVWGYPLFAVIVALDLLSVPIGLRLIQWNADFYNALQRIDGPEAVRQIGIFGLLTAAGASRFLIASFLRKRLQLRWRAALTAEVMGRWLADKRFWRLEQAGDAARSDNPDQRIAEDCRIFVERLTQEASEIFTACVALVTYVSLLWSLSTFPLAFTLFGYPVEIPRYMIWAAPIYVAVSTGMTHWLGRPLYRLSVMQEKREADFRFALARLREFAEPVALTGGEAAERSLFNRRFAALVANRRQLINRELILGLFTRPYQQTVLQIPTFLALPAYLAGQVTLGGLMQLRSAFQNVVTTLSYFIFSYRDLTEFAAATRRLDLFLGDVGGYALPVSAEARQDAGPATPAALIAWHGASLSVPGRASPLCLPDVAVQPGQHVWICGASGIGKSTLVRTLAGLDRHASGTIIRPAAPMLVSPQRVYLPLSEGAAAISYPAAEPLPQEALRQALHRVGLGEHAGRLLDQADNAPAHLSLAGLSGGEQQRLMAARLLLHAPRLAILDEPTSALDAAAEEELFRTLARELPDTTFIIVAHHRPRGLPITHVVDLGACP